MSELDDFNNKEKSRMFESIYNAYKNNVDTDIQKVMDVVEFYDELEAKFNDGDLEL